MKVPELLDNLAIISQLGDNPGTDDGLSAEALKAKFDEAVLIIQRYINGTLLPSLNQVVSPEDGLTMKNDIDMGGHRVKNMAAPEEDGDAVSLAYAKQHFGGSDLADSTYPDCYYRMVDGVKEWINPPMVVGVEYRTTERFNGKPVYVKAVDMGKLPAANAKITIPYVSVTATPIIGFAVTSDRKMIPSVYYSASTNTRMEMHLSLENNTVSVYCTHDKSNATGVATVWYIKE